MMMPDLNFNPPQDEDDGVREDHEHQDANQQNEDANDQGEDALGTPYLMSHCAIK